MRGLATVSRQATRQNLYVGAYHCTTAPIGAAMQSWLRCCLPARLSLTFTFAAQPPCRSYPTTPLSPLGLPLVLPPPR